MDGTAFSKSDAVRWEIIYQRIHVTLRNREKTRQGVKKMSVSAKDAYAQMFAKYPDVVSVT